MKDQAFWEIIDAVHQSYGNDMEGKSDAVTKALSALSGSDARGFSEKFEEKMIQSYTHSLWGAAYLVHGGCGDDTFTDFRASLISRGKRAFETAIADPDSLANQGFDEEAWFFEGYEYAVSEGLKQAVGSELTRQIPFPSEPAGDPWEESPEVFKSTYPNLWQRFGKGWEVSALEVPAKARPWWRFW